MPDSDSIRDQVVQHLLEASDVDIKPEDVKPETSLRENLDLSSLQAVTLVMDLEDKFGIEVEDEEIETLGTVGDVIALIEAKTAQASA